MDDGLTNILIDGLNILSVLPFLTMLMAGADVHKIV